MEQTESRVERKKKEAREHILSAAEQLFIVEHSYEETTIREIARRADVSIGTVYAHFKTKVLILAELVSANTDRIILKMKAAIPPDVTGAEQMETLLKFFEKLRRDPLIALYCRLPNFTPERAADSKQQDDFSGFRTIFSNILKNGNDDGSMRHIKNPDLTAAIIMNISLSFIMEAETSSFTHTPLLHHYDANTVFAGFYEVIRNALGIEAPEKSKKKPGKVF
jgi:AcrR family transcriptional regulator